MTDERIGEAAERRRERQKWLLIGLALVAAALQIGTALIAASAPDGAAPPALTLVAAGSVAALTFLVFRMGDRVSDEFKQRQINFVAVTMMKVVFIGYPAWLLLEHGGLVPELSAIALFATMSATMLGALVWCRLKG